jgi:chemotaxis regulatin CheY-phosphate phosphatase CheZ
MHAAKLDPADEFDALESAVRLTARGRAFLDEFARRLRAAETDRVLNAIERLSQANNHRAAAGHLDVLRRELEAMSASIVQTRREIASIKPSGNNRIVQATEELDFVVRSTERATAEILTAAEGVHALATTLKSNGADAAICQELEMHATNLMIACTFQDLTGQRMTKVVNVLNYLEQRVNTMIEIWSISPEEASKAKPHLADARSDAHLLNGPAREGEGVAQHEVDRLLNEPGDSFAHASQDDIDALFK